MDNSWAKTREALTAFAEILKCCKCGKRPVSAVRHIICAHFFCEKCVKNDMECFKCNVPIQPVEICPDHLIKNFAQYCDEIANIIKEEDLWSTRTDDALETSYASTIIPQTQLTQSKGLSKLPKNINKLNPKGETALHIACVKGQEENVKRLLAADANPNTKDYAHWTPLQEVVIKGHTKICQLLLEAGALPNIPGTDCRTPLHEAIYYNRLAEARMLLSYGANKNIYDQNQKRPIDYCKSEEMRKLLMSYTVPEDTHNQSLDLSRTIDQSFFTGNSSFIVYPSNLEEKNQKLLSQMVEKHKIKITTGFRSHVTHVIVEANDKNIVNLSYDVMMAIVRGTWLLNSEWITLSADLADISELDSELFEISGAPVIGTPKRARENAQNQYPGLFDQCHFYFNLQGKSTYSYDGVLLTKESLANLVSKGGGTVLLREPDPEAVKNDTHIPFHVLQEPSNPLYKCTYYIIYVPGRDQPRIIYNMPHIKTLPLKWLIECIERFKLVDPRHLGLL